MIRHRWIASAAVTLTATVTVGCGVTLESLPLPSPGISGDTYELSAVFTDALNLPFKAKVKLGGADVGEVESVSVANYTARVAMRIMEEVKLPVGTKAELRQATPLGDVFIALSAPPDAQPQTPALQAGSSIPIESTSAGATVEDLMSSVSLLLNGGGLSQVQNIVAELDNAVTGHTDDAANVITGLTDVIRTLNERSADIGRVLDDARQLTESFADNNEQIDAALISIAPAIGTLASTNDDLVATLASLDTAAGNMDEVLARAGDDLVTTIDQSSTALGSIAAIGDQLAPLLATVDGLTPKLASSTRGTSFAFYARVSELSLGALFDPGSRWPDATDAAAFLGSITDVLNRVRARLSGEGLTTAPSVEERLPESSTPTDRPVR